jgi:hypothetical protein
MAHFLLLPQLHGIVGNFFARPAVLTGGLRTPVMGTLFRVASIALEHQLRAFAPAKPALGFIIFGQGFPPYAFFVFPRNA